MTHQHRILVEQGELTSGQTTSASLVIVGHEEACGKGIEVMGITTGRWRMEIWHSEHCRMDHS